MTVHTLCVIQPFDPRGGKVGGIESHMRELVRSTPPEVQILFIGIDEIGDLTIGELQAASFEGREFLMFPILRRTGTDHFRPAKRLRDSLTLSFFATFFRHVPKLRRILKPLRATAEIQRFEFASFGKLLGVPSVQIVHGEHRPNQKIDSLLGRYAVAHEWSERIALKVATRIVGVNPKIIERFEAEFPDAAAKAEMMTVSVNTDLFTLGADFPPPSPFRVIFAGRLDAFKRPDLIFRVIDDLRRRRGVEVEFHYVGSSDPNAVPEFAAVRDVSVIDGVKNAAGVSELLKQCHAGLMMSDIEGMPVFVLELQASGRPLVALDLPQYRLVVEDGVSGALVPRTGDETADVASVADALDDVREKIARGAFRPNEIRHKVMPFSHRTQMKRLFDLHRSL